MSLPPCQEGTSWRVTAPGDPTATHGRRPAGEGGRLAGCVGVGTAVSLRAPPVSCPTDKGLILRGRGAVSAAKQEGRKEGLWKEWRESKREMGKEGMSAAGERRSREIGVLGAEWP